MVFSSAAFLSVLFPLAVLGCLALRRWVRAQNMLLLALSLVFYAWGEIGFLPVMALSALGNALLGRAAYRFREKRWPAALAVALNVGVLMYYKYAGFAVDVLNRAAGAGIFFAAPALPLGVSFFTFQGLSYVLDMRRGEDAPGTVMEGCLYICFFPQLVAGPIVRWSDIRRELRDRRVTLEGVGDGFLRFIPGLAKKVLLADTLGKLADAAYACPDGERGTLLALLGGAAFCMQLYFDFSGYSDMAIGLGRMFGFRFPENFDRPWRSASVQEFWRRWHMTLSRWFRDYVYIPLGGSRRGEAKTALNLLIVFALTGIWHGAGWTFLCWGLWNGLLVILERLRVLRPRDWPRPLAHAYTLLAALLGFMLFRADSITAAAGYFASLAHFVPAEGAANALLYALQPPAVLAFAAGIGLCALPGKLPDWLRYMSCGALLVLSYLAIVSSGYHPFLYFRF